MCIFTYTKCGPCPSCPCLRYHSKVDYCQEHLNAYGWQDKKPIPTYVVIEKDRYGKLNYEDNGVIFRTMPEDDNEQFPQHGCNQHRFEDSRSNPSHCPYHGRGGLREKWDEEGKNNYDARKKKVEEAMQARIEAKQQKKERGMAQKDAAGKQAKASNSHKVKEKELDMEGSGGSCCIVQ